MQTCQLISLDLASVFNTFKPCKSVQIWHVSKFKNHFLKGERRTHEQQLKMMSHMLDKKIALPLLFCPFSVISFFLETVFDTTLPAYVESPTTILPSHPLIQTLQWNNARDHFSSRTVFK